MTLHALGSMHAPSFATDPKHLGFVLARYKFVAKMFTGRRRVLEVGCGDMTGAPVVAEVVGDWTGIDMKSYPPRANMRFKRHDMLYGQFQGLFDGVYALDVLEHIPPEHEEIFLDNMIASVRRDHGVLIIGMPSSESQPYASEQSKLHHVNCKTEDGLRATMARYFHNVFLFGMNDETLHTGYGPMCHYRLALCTGRRT